MRWQREPLLFRIYIRCEFFFSFRKALLRSLKVLSRSRSRNSLHYVYQKTPFLFVSKQFSIILLLLLYCLFFLYIFSSRFGNPSFYCDIRFQQLFFPERFMTLLIYLWFISLQRPSARELLNHKFIRGAKKTNILYDLLERHEMWKDAHEVEWESRHRVDER